MKYLLLILLSSPCFSQVVRSEGALSSVPALTVTGTGSACLKSGPLNVDCATPSATVTSSFTVTGASGLGVTYGVTAGSVTAGGMAGVTTADSILAFSSQAGGGLGLRWGPNNILFGGRLSYDSNNGTLLYDDLYDNSASIVSFRMRTLGTPVTALTMLGSGNVGIGTTSPATTLDVSGAAQFGSGIHKTTATASGYFLAPYWTLAQIQAATPATAELGGIVTCTNCASAYSICQSTGTTLNGFRLGLTGTAACQ